MHICYKGNYITDLRSVVWKLVYLLLASDIMIEFLGGAGIFWRGGQLLFFSRRAKYILLLTGMV